MKDWTLPALLALYLAGTLAYGLWRSRKVSGAEEFMTGGRSLGPVVVGVTLASAFLGPGNILATSEEAFKRGAFAGWSTMTIGLSFLVLTSGLAARYRETGHYTTSGALAAIVGPAVKPVTSAVMVVALTAVNVAVYTGGAAAIAILMGIPYAWAATICGLLVATGVAVGGMRYLASANPIHILCALLGLVLGAWYGIRTAGGWAGMESSVPAGFTSFLQGAPDLFTAWFLANLGAVGSTQVVVQVLGSAGSARDASRGALVAAGIMLTSGLLATIAGLAARALFPNGDPATAFPLLITIMPPAAQGVVMAGIVGGMLAITSGNALAIGTLLVKDFYDPYIRPKAGSGHVMSASRWFSFAAALVPIPFVLLRPGLFPLIFLGRGLRVTLFAVLAAAFYVPLPASGRAPWAIGLGAAATVGWFLAGRPLGIDGAYVSLLVPLMVLFLTHRAQQDTQKGGRQPNEPEPIPTRMD